MNERMMTFNDLNEMRYALESCMIEFPLQQGLILVGKVIDTIWWPGKHIKLIRIERSNLWDPHLRVWHKNGFCTLSFPFNQFEMFSGPYETATGDIFFILNRYLYVRFFKQMKHREDPLGFEPLDAVHQRFMMSDARRESS